MKIGGSFAVPAARERTFQLLQDPDVLARCMPGCDHLSRIGPDEYEMRMKMAISSIQGLFGGKVRIADSNPPASFRLIVEGNGKIGFMKGEGLLTLLPEESNTQVQYDGDVQIGGMIAGVGQRLVESTAKLMIKKFFERLAKEL